LVTMRLPSVCAILLTCLLIYRYARLFLAPLGALAAGLTFASMAQVLELGRMGETDALFTLMVSGALLCWHGGLLRGESLYRVWCTGYALAALGTLTKGPQAPVYFVGPVLAYLLYRRKWHVAFSPAHLAGIATFVVVLGTWQIPCVMKVGLDGIRKMYIQDVGHRFIDANWFSFGEHLVVYPLELFACLLPWSALLIVWFNREFRRTLGTARDPVIFLAICLAVAFPTVWFPPGSRPRYFMSLYPCLALLIGLAVERVSLAQRSEPWWIVWPLFVRITAAAMVGSGVGVLAISVHDFGLWLAQPAWFAVVYALIASALAVVAWRAVGPGARTNPAVAVLAIAGFVGVSYATVMINALVGATVDTEGAIAELKHQLPPGTKLVSFNVTHHLFVFHYREDIPVVPWPETVEEEAAKVPYFCADVREFETKDLPFPWRPVTEISCDRHKMPVPRIRVVVGRRQDVPDVGEAPPKPTGRVLSN
ncbi:MAG TPA: glycosyltransferase family 39 protein, partial [Planctomycetaceae bacterium]|nr:glycosyltransferase family 39 protein [Planctomycetaceae bacterium]